MVMPKKPIIAPAGSQITGENNPNWRGGRSITPDGYVLIRVGVDHPLADVRGYAYEHRLVASKKIGRLVLPEEQVHHKDENRQNNDPDNLKVVSGRAEHAVLHRRRDDLRLPGEPNPGIECACGCGGTFPKYDDEGRPRLYVSGHNPQAAPAISEVREVIERLGPLTIAEIMDLTGKPRYLVKGLVSRMTRRGLICRVSRGVYDIINKE
jgi:hypothetical protein